MQLDDRNWNNYKTKEQWVEFHLNNEFLTAYTTVYDFKEEIKDTLELLAYENGCEIGDIKINKVYKEIF